MDTDMVLFGSTDTTFQEYQMADANNLETLEPLWA